MINRQPIFNAGPAICVALMTAFIMGMNCGLGWLAWQMEFSSFMVLGVLGIAAMIGCGYAWDWLTARR